MKVFETNKKVILNAGETHVQTISSKNIAKATYFLRDKIYTDKLKAAITETLSNAIDEHRKHNVQRPVDVFMFDTEVVIRDYAKGLSNDGVFGTFFQYFESTKSDNNHDIGGFGIGAKAPSAYNPEFYVISFYNGVKTTYCSIVDGYESKASVVHSAEYNGIFPTGIAVRIPFLAENISADKKKVVEILHDLFVQIGFDSEPEFNVYSMVHEDYDDFGGDVANNAIVWDRTTQTWKSSNNASITILSKRASWVTDRQLFRGLLPRDGKNVELKIDKDGNLGFNPLVVMDTSVDKFCINIGDDVLLIKNCYDRWNNNNANSLLSYTFWGSGNKDSLLAYDGDLCYRLQGGLPEKINIDSNLRLIVKFNRGELPITPSRENIENIAQANGYVTRKIRHALSLFVKACHQAFANALASSGGKSTCLAILEGLSEFIDDTFYEGSRGNNSKTISSAMPGGLNPREVISHVPHWGQSTYAYDLKDRYDKVRVAKIGKHEAKVIACSDDRLGSHSSSHNNIGHLFLVLPEDEKAKNKINYTKLFDGILPYIINKQKVILQTQGNTGSYLIGTVTQEQMDEILKLSPSMPKLLRYGVDIFKIEDIAKAYDIAKAIPVVEHVIDADGTKRKRTPVPAGLKDARNDTDIPPTQYGSTLLIQASTFVSADFQYNLKRYGDVATLNALLALTGKSRVASVRKEKIKTFEAAGCVLLSDKLLEKAREQAPTWRYLEHAIYNLANQLGVNSQTVKAAITKAGAGHWLFDTSYTLKAYLMASNLFSPQFPSCFNQCSHASEKAYGTLLLKLVDLATKEELLYLPLRRYEEQINLAYILDDVLKTQSFDTDEVKAVRTDLKTKRNEYAQASEAIKASIKAKFSEALMFTISQLEKTNKNN